MAPEIIEMTGTTTACDVWSVGCTIIELLEGKPPYFDLPQARERGAIVFGEAGRGAGDGGYMPFS